MMFVTLILPVVWLCVSVLGFFLVQRFRWGRIPGFLLPVVNALAIWFLVGGASPDYFFMCLCMAALGGIVWALFTVSRDDDLLFIRYGRQMSFILGIFTTVWWVGALVGIAS